MKNFYKELKKNKEIEKVKNEKFNVFNKQNKILFNELKKYKIEQTKQISQLQTYMFSEMDNTLKKFVQMQQNINSKYENLLSIIKKGSNEVELMSQTKMQSATPCPICYINARDKAFIPCGHTICNECGKRLMSDEENIENIEKCPICREKVDNTFRIFID